MTVPLARMLRSVRDPLVPSCNRGSALAESRLRAQVRPVTVTAEARPLWHTR